MLTINKLQSAQRNFRFFIAFNVVSFSFMTGNILFLYAMRLGAGTRLIGVLASLGSVTFLFSLFGRRIIRRLGVVKTRGYFWLARYIVMIPVLLTLLPAVRRSAPLALGILTVGYFGFNIFKGIGLAAAKPILGYISREVDRAAFISGNNMITFAGQILTGLAMAFLLGEESPLPVYGLFIGTGILVGFLASHYALKLPEPELESPPDQVSLLGSIREALKRPEFSRLILLIMLSNTAIGMTMGFMVVYAKTVYLQPDNLVVFFTVAGALGAMTMALISRFLTDRIGSKPMYFAFTGLRILILMPVIWAPLFGTSRGAFLFLLAVFFLDLMTTWGIHSTADLYFFATTRARDRIDLGIVFNISRGLFGMIGSLGGGFLLAWLQGVSDGGDVTTPFRIYFSLSALFLLATVPLIAKLPDVSDYSIIDLLSIIFSPRDLKAIYYLNKLGKSRTGEEERVILSAMGSNKSQISLKELRRRLDSPGFFVRMEALNALQGFPPDQHTVRLLMDEIRFHPYTTAHIAARMLGEVLRKQNGFGEKLRREGAEVLTAALGSEDYLLKSKAALALGEMGVQGAGGKILTLLEASENPRVIIYCAKALEALGWLQALPVILSRIDSGSNPYLANNLALSASELLGIGPWFYPHFSAFLKKEKRGLNSLRAEIEEAGVAGALNLLLDECLSSGCSSSLQALFRALLQEVRAAGELERIRIVLLFLEGQPEGPAPYTGFLLAAYCIRLYYPA